LVKGATGANRGTYGQYIDVHDIQVWGSSGSLISPNGPGWNLIGVHGLSGRQDGLIAIKGFTDDKGLFINVKAKSLIVARQEWYNALRLTKSVYRPGTADNDINATLMDASVPGGAIQSVYLTSPHAWFIRTDAGGDGKGLIYQERTPIKFFQDNEFDTRNMKAGAMERYTAGWEDPRGVWGNNGP